MLTFLKIFYSHLLSKMPKNPKRETKRNRERTEIRKNKRLMIVIKIRMRLRTPSKIMGRALMILKKMRMTIKNIRNHTRDRK
jgi:hypothetical protein